MGGRRGAGPGGELLARGAIEPAFPDPLLALRGLKSARAMRRRPWNRARRGVSSRTPHGALAPLQRAAALLGRHVAPLVTQRLLPLRGHLSEGIELIANLLLPVRRQRLELAPALA